MSEDRKAWAMRVIESDPELADTLKAFRAEFGATVIKMEHSDKSLSLGEHLPWQSDLAVIARSPMRTKK